MHSVQACTTAMPADDTVCSKESKWLLLGFYALHTRQTIRCSNAVLRRCSRTGSFKRRMVCTGEIEASKSSQPNGRRSAVFVTALDGTPVPKACRSLGPFRMLSTQAWIRNGGRRPAHSSNGAQFSACQLDQFLLGSHRAGKMRAKWWSLTSPSTIAVVQQTPQ